MRSNLLKLIVYAVMAVISLMLTSCAQMTRHSNTLVFGTNTTVGLSVGNDATSTPSIDIGYRRQEVALVPLLANTHHTNSAEGNLLAPCPLPEEINADSAHQLKNILDSCHFRATINDSVRDSYSVLASFGTRSTARTDEGTVEIAQYFATGIAAQQLAKTGGANVIRAGGDAAEIARSTASTNSTSIEILSNNEEQALAYRESIHIWATRDANNPEIALSASDSDTRKKMLQDYIQQEIGGDSGIGLLWLQGASSSELSSITEHFQIPIYPKAVRQRVFLIEHGERYKELSEIEALRDERAQKIFICIDQNSTYEDAKQFIESNNSEIDADELSSIAASVEIQEVSSWSDLSEWWETLDEPTESNIKTISRIISFYISDDISNKFLERICSQ